jgi:transcriptional regulator with XRE-family HTH domain
MSREKGSSLPLGDLLAYFRNRGRLTIRGLADLSHLSHTYLGAVERGDSRLTPNSLTRIADALNLSADDAERLRQAAIDPSDPLVAPGFVVGIDALMKREAAEDVRGVWVMERQPIELDRPEWLEMVGRKLRSECKYAYFVRSRAVWRNLEAKLTDTVGEAVVQQFVVCLEVPENLQPFFFFPGSALYLTTGERNVLGVWAFLGPYSHRIDSGCVMERIAAEELYRVLSPVVDAATVGEAAMLGGLSIPVLHRRYDPDVR